MRSAIANTPCRASLAQLGEGSAALSSNQADELQLDLRWLFDFGRQENPLMYIDVYFRILHAYTIIYSIYLNIGFPILLAAFGVHLSSGHADIKSQIRVFI